MTYLVLDVILLSVGIIAAVLLARGAHASREIGATRRRAALALAAAVLLVLTVVFDNAMIAVGLFTYTDAHLSGLRIGLVPVEDLAYPLAALLLLPALWDRLRARERVRANLRPDGGEEPVR